MMSGMLRPTIPTIALLLAALVPVPAGAQGGDAAFRSLRLQIPLEREYMEPQGLQDAASDLLSADMSTTSSAYVTLMTASVTTGEAGDAVLAHVTGQFGLMNPLYVVDTTRSELWRIADPSSPGAATLVGGFPSGLAVPDGITSHGGSLYVVDSSGDELWRIDDPSSPGAATLEGTFPSGLAFPGGITSHGGSLYVVDTTGGELWRIDDPSSPGAATLEGTFPSGLTRPGGITSPGGSLYVVDSSGDELWRIDDPSSPGAAVLEGDLPSGLTVPDGITWADGSLYVVNRTGSELWRIADPSSPGAATLVGGFPSGLSSAHGITVDRGGSECMIRLARGTTEVEVVSFTRGRILLDATFTDAPPVGTHAYSLQIRTMTPGSCTAYRGNGTVPIPSMLVQSFYAGVVP